MGSACCRARPGQSYRTVWSRCGGTLPGWAFVALVVLLSGGPVAFGNIDLRIAVVAYTAPLPGPVAGETFPVTVTIVNDGTSIAPAFEVDLWKNRSAAPSTAQGSDARQTVDALAPGMENAQTLQFDVAYDSPGTNFLWVLADAAGAVQEVTRDNNAYSAVISVSPSAPDLVIDAIVPSTDLPATGTAFTVTVTVKNQGRLPSEPTNLSVFKNTEMPPTSSAGGDADLPVPALAPGATADVTLDITYDAAGTYTFWTLADSGGVVGESDETNNAAGVTFVVGAGGGGGRKGCGRGVGPANMAVFYGLCLAGLAFGKWGARRRIARR